MASEDSSSWLGRLLGRSNTNIPDSIDPDVDPAPSSDVHEEVRSHGSDYVDGDISASLTDRIKVHLGICGDCNGWMRTLAATVGLVQNVPQEEVPESLRQKIKSITKSD